MSFSLELTNFKTFEKFLFKIPSSGTILIDGVSGKGKTSVIQAIVFAINGYGKKLATYGTKKVKVDLVKYNYNKDVEFTITRQKSPDSLLLKQKEKEYHDDEAQSIINTIFGKNFTVSSVIFQKGAMSFLSLSPKEKLTQIESILFSDFNIDDKKNKIKKIIKEKEDELFSINSKIDTYQNILKSKSKCVESTTFKDLNTIHNCDEYKINLTEKYNSNTRISSENKLELSRLTSLINNDDANVKESSILESTISRLTTDLQECMEELKDYNTATEIEEKKNRFRLVSNSIKFINLKKDLTEEEDRLSKTSLHLISNVEEDIKKVSEDIYDINDLCVKITKLENEYEDIQNVISVKNRIKTIDTKLQERLKYIENNNSKDLEESITKNEVKLEELSKTRKDLELSKLKLKCPCCDASLRYVSAFHALEEYNVEVDDTLSIASIENEINFLIKTNSELKQKISTFKKIIDSIEIIKKEKESSTKEINESFVSCDIEELKERNNKTKSRIEELREQKNKVSFNKNRLKQLEGYMKEIKNNNHPMMVVHIDKIKAIKLLLNNISDIITSNSLEDLEKELNELKILLSDNSSKASKKEKLIERKNKLNEDVSKTKHLLSEIKILDQYERSIITNNIKSIKNDIKVIDKYLSSINLFETLEELEKQLNFLKYSQEIKELEDNISSNITIKNTRSIEVEKYSKLLKCIEISESKLIYKFIDTLNERVNYHLEAMFTEPMTVCVSCFKDTKKGEKPQIDFAIYYKGNETDLINLSGGEFDRLNLAFLLSFNELSESNIIILDEALSSLNQELVADIIEHIQNCNRDSNKLVLMTLHQSIKGMFDEVICL